MADPELAIIGGGASAAILLTQLSRFPQLAGMRVDVYDRNGAFGRGIAYSTDQKVHLLNVRAAGMSAMADDKEDFVRWAATHGYGAADFVPRMMYGDYLCERMAEAGTKLSINFLSADVTGVRKTGEGYELEAGSRLITYKKIIQATGNVKPIRPDVSGEVSGYYDAPWGLDYSAFTKMNDIALIGSGLSAMDAVLALYANGYAGQVKIFSRHNLIPASHITPTPYNGLADVKGINKASPYRLLRLLKMHAGRSSVQWQDVIDAMRPHTNPIWEHWTKSQREKFMKRLFTIWNIHRHRMAPQIMETIQPLITAGRVGFVKASVQGIVAGPSVETKDGSYKADAVINCMGYRYREEGRGFDVTYKIGPPRFGDLFETTAVPEIRQQAAEIIADIIKNY